VLTFRLAAAGVLGLALVLASRANAEVCDYRLSEVIGALRTGGAVSGAVALSGGEFTLRASGFYFIKHASSKKWMLGSTWPGRSGAKTVGIIPRSARYGGLLRGILASPALGGSSIISALGIGASEVACYLTDERITDSFEVATLLTEMAETSEMSPKTAFTSAVFLWPSDGRTELWIEVEGEVFEYEKYAVDDLYIVNGELRHSVWGVDERLGYLLIATE
jgi:hypothetical protein